MGEEVWFMSTYELRQCVEITTIVLANLVGIIAIIYYLIQRGATK